MSGFSTVYFYFPPLFQDDKVMHWDRVFTGMDILCGLKLNSRINKSLTEFYLRFKYGGEAI